MWEKVRFKLELRGKCADVEMQILSMSPIQFKIVFYQGEPGTPLTRDEYVKLCRVASIKVGLPKEKQQ